MSEAELKAWLEANLRIAVTPTDPQVGLADQVGGSLNPTWVCWLMRFPLTWFQAGGKSSQISAESQAQCQIVSACSNPSEMPKSRSKRPPPGSSSEGRK